MELKQIWVIQLYNAKPQCACLCLNLSHLELELPKHLLSALTERTQPSAEYTTVPDLVGKLRMAIYYY